MLAGVFDVGGSSLQTASFETSRIIAGGGFWNREFVASTQRFWGYSSGILEV